MTLAGVFDLALAVTVLAVATWSVAVRATFAAVVAFVAFGLLVAFVWVRLAAIDVALTEAAIGGGIVSVLLLGAAARLRRNKVAVAERPGAAQRLVAAAFCAAVSLALATAVLTLPDPAPTLAPPVAANLPALGLGNPVGGVLLGFRAIDTLLETVVLLLALIGVWSLAPDLSWGGRPRALHPARLEDTLVYLARLLPPVGIVVGVYIVWVGANAPGGKFQGGTILAAMWILVMMAGLRNPPSVARSGLRLFLVAGPALFFAVGLAGFAIADGFLAYPASYAKLTILLIELVLTPSVAVTLGLLVAGPPVRDSRQ
jgi:multisubunit Na+/H+ antiporter MnhB subunit